MARSARRRPEARGRAARALSARTTRREGAPQRRLHSVQRQHRVPEHHTAATEEHMPGDAELENRIRSYVRWNAMAMVMRANKHTNVGGHIASFASAATLYDVGFNHFWRAQSETFGGDLVFVQGHSAPGVYARAFMLGRLTAGTDGQFPPGSRRQGPLVLSAPVADAGLLAVPDRVDGPGPADGDLPGAFHALHEGPRHTPAAGPQGVGVHGRRRNGRAGIAGRDFARRPREARQPDIRHQLQSAAARRAGARQRQDHPGTGSRLPRRRLERDQGDLGRLLGSAASCATPRACC